MILGWLDGRKAAEIGVALADDFAAGKGESGSMEQLLRRADGEVRPLQLNFYKKAKLANSFKWRLIENGVARKTADEVTQSLIVHLSRGQIPAISQNSAAIPTNPADRAKVQHLFNRGYKFFEQGAYSEAAALFEEVIALDSSHA